MVSQSRTALVKGNRGITGDGRKAMAMEGRKEIEEGRKEGRKEERRKEGGRKEIEEIEAMFIVAIGSYHY